MSHIACKACCVDGAHGLPRQTRNSVGDLPGRSYTCSEAQPSGDASLREEYRTSRLKGQVILLVNLDERIGGKNMANQKYEVRSNDATSTASPSRVDMKFEIVVIPVSDVDRAKEFYARLG